MNFTPEQLARVAAVLRSNDRRFIALVRAAGLDPARDLVGADLQRVDFGADLYDGFDFAFTDLHGAKLDRAHGLRAAMFFRARFDETTLWPEGLRAEIAGFDVEAAARALILDGQAPPKHWEDMIRRLDLSASDKEWEKFLAGGVPQPEGGAAVFRRTELLANLRNLEYLDLSNTQVSDLSPIAHLYKLQSLNLKGTQVSDLAPIILNSDRKSE